MKTILVLTDFLKPSEHAAEYALEIAAKANAEILMYHAFYAPQVISLESGVYPYYEDYSFFEQESLHKMEKIAKKITKRFFDRHGNHPPAIHMQNEPGKPGHNVHNLSLRKDIWMIVMGDKSRDGIINRFIFGSNSNDIIDNATCPVLLVPEKADLAPIKGIVYATELQRTEHPALLFLEKIAMLWLSPITVLHVCDKVLTVEEKVSHYNYYKQIVSGIKYPDIHYMDVLGDKVTETISNYTRKEKIDLIAVVHKTQSFTSHLLHKSISKEMMNYHHVPLLILHK